MKEFMVSVDILTQPMSTEKFLELCAVEASSIIVRDLDEYQLWCIDSGLENFRPLPEQIRAVLRRIPISFTSPDCLGSSLLGVYLNIGVIHDKASSTVEIPYDCVNLAAQQGVAIHVTYYLAE